MKKVLVTLVCLLMMGGVMAQEEHLSFKGVPIDGTLKQYTDAMVKKGFKYEGKTDDGMAFLSGDFAGFKGCMVGVSTLTSCDVVNRIGVLFPEKDTWATLVYDYENLKSMLTTKYGEPAMNREEFMSYTGDSNSLRMHALNDDELVWFTAWSTELGDIELSLVGGNFSNEGRVRLMYYDRANTETVNQSVLDDL